MDSAGDGPAVRGAPGGGRVVDSGRDPLVNIGTDAYRPLGRRSEIERILADAAARAARDSDPHPDHHLDPGAIAIANAGTDTHVPPNHGPELLRDGQSVGERVYVAATDAESHRGQALLDAIAGRFLRVARLDHPNPRRAGLAGDRHHLEGA